MNLEFVDFPPDRRSNPIYQEVADALRENPGKWAKWPEEVDQRQALRLVSAINAGRVVPMKKGFRASTRGGTLLVAYLGGES